MFLRATNKENIMPQIQVKNAETSKVRIGQGSSKTLQISQKNIILPAADQVNIQVLQEELNRVRQAYQQERKDKWTIAQEKTKLQGQNKVLQIERDNQYRENQKLKIQLKESFNKLKDTQTKINSQTTEFYSMKNENTSLNIQVRKLKDQTQRQQQKWNKLTGTNQQLETKNRELWGEISHLRNDMKLKQSQIDMLRHSLCQLETESRRLMDQMQSTRSVQGEEVAKVCRQLQNWKTAFEKKEQELQTKTGLLNQQNDAMKKTIEQLSNQLANRTSFGLHRAVTLPSDLPNKQNQTHVRLFIKQNQIEHLTKKTKQLQQTVQSLQLQNALLSKKVTEGTVFSPAGYQKYNQVQNAIFKSCQLKRQTRDLKLELEAKQKQVECLTDKVSESAQQFQSTVIECRKLEAEMEMRRISHENTVSELSSLKTKLQREVQLLKTKTESLQKECREKDQIIVNYVNKLKS